MGKNKRSNQLSLHLPFINIYEINTKKPQEILKAFYYIYFKYLFI